MASPPPYFPLRGRVGLEPPRFLIGWLVVVRSHVEAGFPGPWAGMAEAGNVASGLGLPGEVSQWPLKRYGRFMLLDTAESPGPSPEDAVASSPTWKVRPEGGKDRQLPDPQGSKEDPGQQPHRASAPASHRRG